MNTVTAVRTPARGPLPGAPVRLAPAPAAEPPYETARARRGASAQEALALTFTLPSGAPTTPPVRPQPTPPGLPAAPGGPAPEPDLWASVLARGIVEVLEGDRPVTQLVHWTAPGVYATLCRRVAAVTSVCSAVRSAQQRAVARRVHVCRPAPHVAEVAAAVHGPDRAWAMAFRLELKSGHWLCTELLLG